ncbi:hypothetical protein JCM1840_001714 [Sporobolomyces johnsonii]
MPPRASLDAFVSQPLFLTFLAPLYHPPPARLDRTRRHLSTAAQVLGTAAGAKSGSAGLGGTAAARGKGNGAEQHRRMSGLAMPREEASTEQPNAPVASTSAVRLDSPLRQPAPHPSPCKATLAASTSASDREDDSISARDLPAVLQHLRTLHAAFPDDSPSSIIRQARPFPFQDDDAHSPPAPPPPIVLHPQPYSNSRLLVPTLLQALILGASALGLFTRRKVRTSDSVAAEREVKAQRTAREEAEDQVDELQALNLLVSAYAVPEASGVVEPTAALDWREKSLEPLVSLVSRTGAMGVQADRLTVASLLHYVSLPPTIPTPSFPSSLPETDYSLARPLLGLHAWNTYAALPPVVSRPSSPAPTAPPPASSLDDAILASFLSLIYPVADRQTRFLLEDHGRQARLIVNEVATRLLKSSSTAPTWLLHHLGLTAARARRLDILQQLLGLSPPLPPEIRLELAVRTLQLLASREEWRGDRELVVSVAEHFAAAVRGLGNIDDAQVELLNRGLRLQQSMYSIDQALQPYVVSTVRELLQSANAARLLAHPTLLVDVLRYLVKTRHPRAALAIFRSLPSPNLTLAHFEAILPSSHDPTSQAVWDALLAHPTLDPTPSTFSARFTSHAHGRSPPSALQAAYRDVTLMNRTGVPKTLEIWNKLLQVLVRHGTDMGLTRVLKRMRKDGVQPDRGTMAILAQREMVRQDVQLKKGRSVGRDGEVVERVTVQRRRGGVAQMRKVRETVRAWETKLATSTTVDADRSKHEVDIMPNILLKNLSRWPLETDTPRLIELTKLSLDIDLSPLDPTSPWPSDVAERSSPSSCAPTPPPLPSNVDISPVVFDKLRRPAYKMLIKAFDHRGRGDLARELRMRLKTEKEEVRKKRILDWRAGSGKEQ